MLEPEITRVYVKALPAHCWECRFFTDEIWNGFACEFFNLDQITFEIDCHTARATRDPHCPLIVDDGGNKDA